MKRFINILLSICYIFSLTSCLDDILTKKPLDMITDDMVWNDEAAFEAFMTDQYSRTHVFVHGCTAGSGHNSKQMFGPAQLATISDEADVLWGHAQVKGVRPGGLTINSNFQQWWDQHYQLVRNLNMIIERLPNTSFDSEYKTLRIAEARFIRAFSYFEMVRRYGGVPLITKTLSLDASEEEAFPFRDKEQVIYDFVISECDAIKGDLAKTTQYGRPDEAAAEALKCRAALYAGSIAQWGKVQLDGVLGIPADKANDYYQKCLDAAKAIMNDGKHGLFNKYPDNKVKNFQSLFLEKKHEEDIFVVQHTNVPTEAGGNSWGWDFHQRPKPHPWGAGMGNLVYLETVEAFDYLDGHPRQFNRAELESRLWNMDELFAGRDPRCDASIYRNGTPYMADGQNWPVDFHKGIIDENGKLQEAMTGNVHGVPNFGTQNNAGWGHNFGTGLGVMKYLDQTTSPTDGYTANSKTDYIVFRYGEILLNAAEAAFEMGKTAEALDYVNQIRERAGIFKLTNITRDDIRKERFTELLFEGHRYYDLRRWRIAEKVLSEFRSGIRYILDYNSMDPDPNNLIPLFDKHPKYRIKVLKNYQGQKPQFFEKNYYLPIKRNRTKANINLVENPGYESN